MEVRFIITDVPTGEQQRYALAYLEGIAEVIVGDRVLFRQPGILLAELADVMKSWLDEQSERRRDFVYISMDHDEPILVLERLGDDRFRMDSIWREQRVDDVLTESVIIMAFQNYLRALADALAKYGGWPLRDILGRADS